MAATIMKFIYCKHHIVLFLKSYYLRTAIKMRKYIKINADIRKGQLYDSGIIMYVGVFLKKEKSIPK